MERTLQGKDEKPALQVEDHWNIVGGCCSIDDVYSQQLRLIPRSRMHNIHELLRTISEYFDSCTYSFTEKLPYSEPHVDFINTHGDDNKGVGARCMGSNSRARSAAAVRLLC